MAGLHQRRRSATRSHGPRLVIALTVLLTLLLVKLNVDVYENASKPMPYVEAITAASVSAPLPVNTTKSTATPEPFVYRVDANGTRVILRPSDFLPRPESPYEKRWKGGWQLPPWAEKPFWFRVPIPEDKRVCFVHVGKASGSSVGCFLGFQLHCGDEIRVPVGLLPTFSSNVVHNDVHDCFESNETGYYLFTIRNPLKRIQSAYVYDRPRPSKPGSTSENELLLYSECPFWTLNDLALRGLAKNGTASDTCRQRAYQAIRGQAKFGWHLFFNYAYYVNETVGTSSTPIMVLRTEHLRTDWASAEAELSGYRPLVDFPEHNKLAKDGADTILTDEARLLLCDALCDDISVYVDLLHRAINLTPEQVQESMNQLYESCPREILTCLSSDVVTMIGSL